LVRSGAKRTTIRPAPRRLPRVGQEISLRRWTGLPYRSKQEVLRESVIVSVDQIAIGADWITINGIALEPIATNTLAVEDGFQNFGALTQWFLRTHKQLPFVGILIRWKV
jgi:hypothetical protein